MIRLDVRATADGQKVPSLGQVDLFAVDAASLAAGFDEKLHISNQTSLPSRRRMFRRGTIDQQAIDNGLHAGKL